jgi:hypothetical protein
MRPIQTLGAFDLYLAERSLRFEGIVIGGAALNLLGIVSRATRDCDILYPALPAEILIAAQAFAADRRRDGEALAENWLNNGPADLVSHLPDRWEKRLQPAFYGRALELHSLGREDLLRTKLFALCDRGFDLADCLALAPTATELAALVSWVEQQDLNPDWPAHVRETLANLAARLGHAL